MVLWHVQVSDLRSEKEHSLAKLEIRVSSSPHTLLSTSTLYAVSLVFFFSDLDLYGKKSKILVLSTCCWAVVFFL